MNGRVIVIGLGLIGGSLALCIKKEHNEATIVGFDINKEQSRLAKMLGVIDEIAETIEDSAIDANLIIIAAPVNETKEILQMLAKLPLHPDVIITDTGSTKRKIVESTASLKDRGITFIGGHPMAGSHKSGVSAAKEILFENAFYLLTPDNQIEEAKVERLKCWLLGTKAKFLTITPENHDYLTGIVSHFPHIIAASIVRQTEKLSASESLIPRLAAGGFRDITRIASSSPEMWKDILLHNREILIGLLNQWQEEMNGVKGLLENEDSPAILNYFNQAKQFRDGLPMKEKGAIPAFYDLYVDIPDYPGVISEITGYLAKEDISITNIRILETREDINGVLVISFQTEEDRYKAERCIETYSNFQTSIGS
ncbi:prephenate dehydrogenase [Neobacillus vireti]|uniref:Prephenate dehydrogenase n=1 Tax=Neobacillus vireti LMG 21834 TaxID=1131730 RepID=A0AB94IH94_9BACI|nr:prephenate dehydrogenase [Neobacillus vireti]ETI66487.1 prephenate dehydrogenase [Neobacillus vireti LMG 21834]KLT17171.1 prephenate dehydrogenase [Neobacillus vireti]